MHVGDCVNVMDAVDSVTEIDDVKIQGFGIATLSEDGIGGVPKN